MEAAGGDYSRCGRVSSGCDERALWVRAMRRREVGRAVTMRAARDGSWAVGRGGAPCLSRGGSRPSPLGVGGLIGGVIGGVARRQEGGVAGGDGGQGRIQTMEGASHGGGLDGRVSGEMATLRGGAVLDGGEESEGVDPVGAMEGGGEGVVGGLVVGLVEGLTVDGEKLGVGVVVRCHGRDPREGGTSGCHGSQQGMCRSLWGRAPTRLARREARAVQVRGYRRRAAP